MRVLAHPDPVVLERALLRELDRVHPAGEPGRTLVIVPTRRLVRHLQRRLGEQREAWLGLDVMHFRSVARRIVESSAALPPRIAPARLQRALLRRVLAGLPANRWSRFVERRPGTLGALLSALRELRDAGVTPDELKACSEPGIERDLAAAYRGLVEELDRRKGGGWVDDAGLIAAALPQTETFSTRYGSVLVHGIYEMIGIHQELLRAVERGAPVTVLAPFDAGGRATAYGREFAERFLAMDEGRIEAISAADGDPRSTALATLYDEGSEAVPSAALAFGFHHVQGAAAEAEVGLRMALAALREGCPPDEIVVAARSLTPFVAGLEREFSRLDDEAGGPLPWDTSVGAPLRRQPLVRDLLLLLRTVADGFPRRAAAELLRSPRIRWGELERDLPSTLGERADLWSREAGLICGLDEWSEDLLAWAARVRHREDADEEERAAAEGRAAARAGAARMMAGALRALRDAVDPGQPRRWTEHAAQVAGFLAWLRPDEKESRAAEALAALEGLLDEMRGLVDLAGDDREVPFAEMVGWLEEAVDETLLPIRDGEGVGIRVLDVMQLRGLTCRRLFLLGMNSGLFPRVPPPDPVLGDGLRRRLRENSGRPLIVRDDAVSEERQLLTLTLGAATERIDVSWQRADETGRSKTPSLALRELARVASGRPDVEALLGEECHWPSHPLHWLEALEQRTGLLAPDESALLAALRANGPDAAGLVEAFPELAAGLNMLRATESFAPGDAAFDGAISGGGLPERLAVTALETLGCCPLRYFFRNVLRVEELEAEADPLEISPRDLGLELHGVLERLYAGLAADGFFDDLSAGELTREALARLETAWSETLSGPIGRMTRRLPLLGEQTMQRWKEALAAFLREDLRRIVDEGWRPTAFEERGECAIELADGSSVRLVGRFDRRLAGESGELIGDYKSGSLEGRGDPTQMLKGRALQVPLYQMMAGEGSAVELLGVGPKHTFDSPDPIKAGRQVRFRGFESAEQHEGFGETVQVLTDLARRGRYPLDWRDGFFCSHCPYDQACRRNHPPTKERENHDRTTGDYRDLRKKNKTRSPRLGDLPPDERQGGGGEV